jgi:nucleotide-binding universal stress UspA family protein
VGGVVCVDPVPKYLGEPYRQEAITARMNQADEILERALEVVGTVPGALHVERLEGHPAEAILAVAETRGVELIVMGTRGLGRLAGLMLGSQSPKVAALAICPVRLVR